MNDIQILEGNCLDLLPRYQNQADLILTSPPYGTVRDYEGNLDQFDFKAVASACNGALKDTGVLVWVVGDQSVKKSLTLEPMRQALYFRDELGMQVVDIMIYQKNRPLKVGRKYMRCWEYMFILTKTDDYTFNRIEDRKNKWAGWKNWGKNTKRQADGTMKEATERDVIPDFGPRINIWRYATGVGPTTDYQLKVHEHPAMMPVGLARDHITSWTNEGDLVIDPMCGSGTTLIAAEELNRRAVGIEVVPKYAEVARDRLKDRLAQGRMI